MIHYSVSDSIGQHRRPPEQTHGAIPAHLLDH